jgi:membrane protein implicated in regulation of membrane protease activity
MVIWWLAVAVLAAIGETFTMGLFLAPVAVAAVVTAGVAIFIPFLLVQVLVFAVLSLLGIGVFRPMVVETFGLHSTQVSGPVAQTHLIGRRAVVTRAIDAGSGQIRVGEGEFWTARPYDPATSIPTGKRVEIVLVDGLTALVEPVPEPPALETESTPETQKGSTP